MCNCNEKIQNMNAGLLKDDGDMKIHVLMEDRGYGYWDFDYLVICPHGQIFERVDHNEENTTEVLSKKEANEILERAISKARTELQELESMRSACAS